MTEESAECARLARSLHAALHAAGSTLAVAESLTGGLLAVALAEAPGASDVFLGSVTAYATDVKADVLRVDPELLETVGAVHPEVARQMAEGVRGLMQATYALATTGVAGPAPQDGHPPGTVHLAVAGPHDTATADLHLDGDREDIQRAAVLAALRLLQDRLRPHAAPHEQPH